MEEHSNRPVDNKCDSFGWILSFWPWTRPWTNHLWLRGSPYNCNFHVGIWVQGKLTNHGHLFISKSNRTGSDRKWTGNSPTGAEKSTNNRPILRLNVWKWHYFGSANLTPFWHRISFSWHLYNLTWTYMYFSCNFKQFIRSKESRYDSYTIVQTWKRMLFSGFWTVSSVSVHILVSQ